MATYAEIKAQEKEAKNKIREYAEKDKLASDIGNMLTKSYKLTPEQMEAYKRGLPEAEKSADKAQREAETAAGIPDKGEPMFYEKLRKSVPYKKGGSVSSASKRADGIAQRGKTKGRYL